MALYLNRISSLHLQSSRIKLYMSIHAKYDCLGNILKHFKLQWCDILLGWTVVNVPRVLPLMCNILYQNPQWCLTFAFLTRTLLLQDFLSFNIFRLLFYHADIQHMALSICTRRYQTQTVPYRVNNSFTLTRFDKREKVLCVYCCTDPMFSTCIIHSSRASMVHTWVSNTSSCMAFKQLFIPTARWLRAFPAVVGSLPSHSTQRQAIRSCSSVAPVLMPWRPHNYPRYAHCIIPVKPCNLDFRNHIGIVFCHIYRPCEIQNK